MLLNSQSIKGMPVICGANGERIGTVSEVRYTPGSKKIDGILVQDQRRLSGSIYISLDKIITFGEAAVIVQGDYLQERKALEKSSQILGITVMDLDGREIGTISDIVFDSEKGSVVGYEISKGFIDDLMNGRNLLPGDHIYHLSNDVLVISAEQSDNLRSNNGGLKNIFFNGF